MKRTVLLILSVVVMSSTLGCLSVTKPPLSKLAVRVIDDAGEPVSNAYIEAWTYWKPDSMPWGLTDTNGVFQYKDRVYREIGYLARKKDYYDSLGTAWWPEKLFEIPATNLVVELKRIIEPVPMVVKEVNVTFPRLDEPVGFDFEIGDWVVPDGKGKITDVLLTAKGHYVSDRDYLFSVSGKFTGTANGSNPFYCLPSSSSYLKSKLPPPPVAPYSGYEPTFEIFTKWLASDKWPSSSHDENKHQIFRVRSVLDESNGIKLANYGWTVRDFGAVPVQDKCSIIFKYYYNPDPTSRSLEPKEIADRQAKDIPEEAK